MTDDEPGLQADDATVEATLSSLDGVGYLLDTEGHLRAWNDRLPAVSGYDDAALSGCTRPTSSSPTTGSASWRPSTPCW